MSGRVPSRLGGGPGSISQVRDRLELLREPVDPPRLGIDTGGHGITHGKMLDRRRVGEHQREAHNSLHGITETKKNTRSM